VSLHARSISHLGSSEIPSLKKNKNKNKNKWLHARNTASLSMYYVDEAFIIIRFRKVIQFADMWFTDYWQPQIISVFSSSKL
jgi:hypothetical protein